MEQLEFFDKMEKTKHICLVCGNDFEKYKRKKYCSKDCFKKVRKEKIILIYLLFLKG